MQAATTAPRSLRREAFAPPPNRSSAHSSPAVRHNGHLRRTRHRALLGFACMYCACGAAPSKRALGGLEFSRRRVCHAPGRQQSAAPECHPTARRVRAFGRCASRRRRASAIEALAQRDAVWCAAGRSADDANGLIDYSESSQLPKRWRRWRPAGKTIMQPWRTMKWAPQPVVRHTDG